MPHVIGCVRHRCVINRKSGPVAEKIKPALAARTTRRRSLIWVTFVFDLQVCICMDRLCVEGSVVSHPHPYPYPYPCRLRVLEDDVEDTGDREADDTN